MLRTAKINCLIDHSQNITECQNILYRLFQNRILATPTLSIRFHRNPTTTTAPSATTTTTVQQQHLEQHCEQLHHYLNS